MIRKICKSKMVTTTLILTLLLSCLPITSIFAVTQTIVTIDGKTLQSDVAPIIIEGRTLVPLRAIFEALGAEVEWDNSSRTVTGRKDTTTIVLPIGSRSPTINGTPVQLDVPGTIVSGRTMVPARFIAESLGASVDWVEETRTVVIISDGLTKVAEEIPSLEVQNLQSRIDREPIVRYFGYSTEEIKAAFGTPNELYSSEETYSYVDENIEFWFLEEKVKLIRLIGYNKTDQHNFLGFGRGVRMDDIIKELGEFEWEENETDEIYFGYSTDDYSLNFRGGGEFSEFLESIEIFKK